MASRLPTLESDLVTAIEVAGLSQTGAGIPTRAITAWSRDQRLPHLAGTPPAAASLNAAGLPLYHLRLFAAGALETRDANAIYTRAIVDLELAFGIEGAQTEIIVQARAALVSETITRSGWWRAASVLQIKEVAELGDIEVERIGRVLSIQFRADLTLLP